MGTAGSLVDDADQSTTGPPSFQLRSVDWGLETVHLPGQEALQGHQVTVKQSWVCTGLPSSASLQVLAALTPQYIQLLSFCHAYNIPVPEDSCPGQNSLTFPSPRWDVVPLPQIT